LKETKRIDPHNSFLAILYRIGVFGLLLILGIVLREFFRGFQILRAGTLSPLENCLIIASLASVVYCLLHAATDVTLENPFKGTLLWILLGFCRILSTRRLFDTNEA
jgi:O-antigen ligase